MILKAISQNLKGTFSWNKYIDHGNHDHKFGPNKLEFVMQLPVLGLLGILISYFLLGAAICIINLHQWYLKANHEKQKKSNRQSIKNS